MYLSMNPTCSSRDVVFSITPISKRAPRKHSNCPSIIRCLTRKPPDWYTCSTFLMALVIRAAVCVSKYSTVPNLIFNDVVTSMGMLLIFMISPPRVTSLFLSNTFIGSALYVIVVSTWLGGRRTVFPFNDPRSGPKMSSAAMISLLVTGQFGSKLLVTIRMSSFMVTCPSRRCKALAYSAFTTSALVYLVLLSLTVFTSTVASLSTAALIS